ncbi:hypothetical protein C4A75_02810 [Brevibacillus laterosporus]|uniref:YlqD family protein n=1 Tax=Brevibacillus laterosporus TaxID=1465 RepID=UPI000CE302B7|nr:YlqD family protein [Brevibacillus laterosporus]PPA86924.1 hypothetical protein C4A75_02810 [Brevibacillus laterosporus]
MISIERLVHIKVVLTEKTKALLREEYERKAQYVHMELEQWRFQRKKILAEAEKRGSEGVRLALERLDQEEGTLRKKLELISIQLEQVERLPLESELHQQTLKSQVEMEVGDRWNEKMADAEIIIRDGIVIEIRQGGKSS